MYTWPQFLSALIFGAICGVAIVHGEPAICTLAAAGRLSLILSPAGYARSSEQEGAEIAKRCIHHPNRPARTNLDGDDLCQECANDWVRGEGDHAAWLEAEERAALSETSAEAPSRPGSC